MMAAAASAPGHLRVDCADTPGSTENPNVKPQSDIVRKQHADNWLQSPSPDPLLLYHMHNSHLHAISCSQPL
jgi:hypothetical protein